MPPDDLTRALLNLEMYVRREHEPTYGCCDVCAALAAVDAARQAQKTDPYRCGIVGCEGCGTGTSPASDAPSLWAIWEIWDPESEVGKECLARGSPLVEPYHGRPFTTRNEAECVLDNLVHDYLPSLRHGCRLELRGPYTLSGSGRVQGREG